MAAPISPELRRRVEREGPKLATVLGQNGAARHFGVSKTTFRRIINPALAERMRVASRDAKRRRRGTCIDCGAETRYAGKGNHGGVSPRCPACAAAAARIWNEENIVAAIKRWAEVHGRPPKAMEWLHVEHEGDCPHPNFGTVYGPSGRFESWAAAIEAAGFPRPSPGYYERTPETLRKLSEARTRWTPELIIAAIQEWVEHFGSPPRNSDWNPTLADHLGLHHRATLWHSSDGHWPHVATVRKNFGTMSAAVRAAGYEPRRPNQRQWTPAVAA